MKRGPLGIFARETAARPDAVDRLNVRMQEELGTTRPLRDLLATLPAPAPGADERVRTRLRRPAPSRLVPFGAGLLVLAAAAAVVLFFYGPVVSVTPLDAPLESKTTWQAVAATNDVHLDFQGAGKLGGTSRAPVIEWEVGTLQVEVEPEQGIDLVVRTREGEARVLGTGFDVVRDALGMTVAVRHGHVAVICADGQKELLGAGERRTCLPTNAAGLLGRARMLMGQGASGETVLETARAGLSTAADTAVREELVLVQVEALTTLDRAEEALVAAEAALERAPTRPTDLRHFAAKNALRTRGCPAALPHLAALVSEGATGPELVQYADCVGDTDPVAARAALIAALRQAPPGYDAAIVERLTRLQAAGP